jgi:small-conductance mechanosensitive channel
MFDRIAEDINALAVGEWGRILVTLLAVAITALAMKSVKGFASRHTGGDLVYRRERLVFLKNGILLACTLAILSVWASKIAGFALSLAAVAGAALIVSKELLLNLLGSLVLTVSRPFRIGDFVEIAGVRGRVVDTDWATTTLTEALESHQATGRTVMLPNSLLLSQPLRNESSTGEFILQVVRISVAPGTDLERLEQHLLAAGREVCGPWIEQASRHFARLSMRSMVDLPTAEPRVLIDLSDGLHWVLALRYACRPGERVRVEQELLRRYVRSLRQSESQGPHEPQEGGVELAETSVSR